VKYVWTLVLRVEGKGCASYIASALIHIYRIKGVQGARVRGREILVLLSDRDDALGVVSDPVLNEYYTVREWSIVEGNLLSSFSEFRLG